MIRKITFAFGIFVVLVVLSGYIPQLIVYQGEERLMLGLFALSVIDDVTHGVTALAALVASLYSRKLSLLFLTAFGYYYALDATFYLVFGLFNDKGLIANVLLNLPHVVIASIMLWSAYALAERHD